MTFDVVLPLQRLINKLYFYKLRLAFEAQHYIVP